MTKHTITFFGDDKDITSDLYYIKSLNRKPIGGYIVERLKKLEVLEALIPEVKRFIKDVDMWDTSDHLYTDNVKEFEKIA